MAGVEAIEQRARLGSAHFAKGDAVWTPAQSGLQQVVERGRVLVCVGLAFSGQDFGLLDMQLGGIFDDDDAFVVGDRLSKDVQERGPPGSGSATDKDGVAARTTRRFSRTMCFNSATSSAATCFMLPQFSRN